MRHLSVADEYKNYKQLVLNVLENYPETRDSDTSLYLRCCRELGANTIDDLEWLNLNIVTVHKTRQYIQNREGKFRPSEEIEEVRSQRAKEIKNIMKQS